MLRRETYSIAAACFLGGVIGTFTALELSARFAYGSWLWVLGMLLGSVIAYCAVDPREFFSGVVRAYRKTIAWKPEVLFWQAALASFLGIGSFVLTTLLIATIGLTAVVSIGKGGMERAVEFLSLSPIMFALFLAFVTLVVGLHAVLALCSVPGKESDPSIRVLREAKWREMKEEGWNMARKHNPLAFIRGALASIRKIAENTPSALRSLSTASMSSMRKVAEFLGWTFAYVHSGRRKLCLVAAAIGITLGFYLGSTLTGGMLGLITGVLLYEIVSVRWLKLVPSRQTS